MDESKRLRVSGPGGSLEGRRYEGGLEVAERPPEMFLTPEIWDDPGQSLPSNRASPTCSEEVNPLQNPLLLVHEFVVCCLLHGCV